MPKRRITSRSIAIIDVINRYRFAPTSFIVRLIDGDMRTTERHLQNLYHQGLINRFAFPSTYYPTEFNYYLDEKAALDTLNEQGYEVNEFDRETVRNNREKKYFEITMGREMIKFQGRLMHLHHELMISRFHYMLERACTKSVVKVKLLGFYQGSQLWNTVEVSKVYQGKDGRMVESEETEILPHRPDAFFALSFPDREGSGQEAYYFYEADRKTTSIKKMQRKLRSHFHYIVKQKKHVKDYGMKRIRAVLTESVDSHWTQTLRSSARHSTVSGKISSPLFWFTPSDKIFEQLLMIKIKGKERKIPIFLERPELVFGKIWATPTDEEDTSILKSLID